MSRKSLIWIGVTVGSTIGGLVPLLWDPNAVFSSVLFGAVGGLLGIWAAFKITS